MKVGLISETVPFLVCTKD